MAGSGLIVTSQTQPIYLHHSICLVLVRVKLDINMVRVLIKHGTYITNERTDITDYRAGHLAGKIIL